MKKSAQEIVRRTRGRDNGDSNGNTLIGGAGDDELGISNASGNILDGGTGNDTLTALGGGNYLDGVLFVLEKHEAANDGDATQWERRAA